MSNDLNRAQRPSCHGPSAEEIQASGLFTSEGGVVISINPEARVTATRIGPSIRCDGDCASIRIPVHVINKGGVTAPLRAVLVRPNSDRVTVSLTAEPLSGAPTERRELELWARGAETLDVTIAFEISPEGGDLAGRDRLHFLLKREQ